MSISYSVQVDWARDGTYGHALAELSGRVKAMRWGHGLSSVEQTFAPPARLSATLDNADGAFSPDASGAAYYGLLGGDALIRVRATADGVTRTMWVGKVKTVQVTPGEFANADGNWREAVIEAECPTDALLDTTYMPPLMTNVRVDEALSAAFDGIGLAWPYDGYFWVLDYSALEDNLRLYDAPPKAFETAKTTLTWAGDVVDRGQGANAQTALRQWVEAEAGGRFFWDARTAQYTFHNRDHDVEAAVSSTLTAGQIVGVEAVYGDLLANVVTVLFTPRRIGAANGVLWTAEPFTLRKQASRTLTARYSDPNAPNASVAAQDVIVPVSGTDLTAVIEGTSDSALSQIGMTVEIGASAAKITLTNSGTANVSVTLLRIRGTPLITYRGDEVTLLDLESIVAYGRRELTMRLSALDDAELATDVARVWLARRRTPVQRWSQVTLMTGGPDSTVRTAGLARAVGERVRLSESWSAHDGEYIVIGEAHRVEAASGLHETTWTLKPAAMERWWTLEDDDLGRLDDGGAISL